MKKIFFITLCLIVLSKSVFAVDPFLDWKTIESENLFVHYAVGNKEIAERALVIAEAAHHQITKQLNWQPQEKTHVVLSDETDFPNGFATPLFLNHTVLFLAPPTSINTLEDFDDWFSTLIFHEYTHIVHLDKSEGSPESLRKIFGRFAFLFPNVFQPTWVLEGIATYVETEVERGVGRGQSTMFASMMREEVANGLQPLSHVNLPVSTWPGGTTRYLYGVYFMMFIAQEYGEEKLQQWFEEYSNNLIPFFINTAANQTFDKNLTTLWGEFHQWLQDRFQPQIESIEAQGLTKGVQISSDTYQTDSVRVIASSDSDRQGNHQGDDVYYVRNSGYKRASLIRIRAGKTEELVDLNGNANLDLHPQAGVLLTQDEFCNNYTIYKDIYRYDEKEGELKRLTNCGRYLYASWYPNGKEIIAVHHEAQRLALHLLDENAEKIAVLWQANNGEIIGQIDVSPDGNNIVASVWRKGEGWNIELFNLNTNDWQKITSGASIAAYPQFTDQGDIIFSQEANGVYNIQRYVLGSDTFEQLTNLTGGAFQSSQGASVTTDEGVKNGALYYTGYTIDGFAIFKLDADATSTGMVTTTADAQCSLAYDDTMDVIDYSHFHNQASGDNHDVEIATDIFTITHTDDSGGGLASDSNHHQPSKQYKYVEKDYSPLSNMEPQWWFPSFAFDDQRSELGLTTTGGDVLGVHRYSLSASYDTKLNAAAGGLSYAYADRFFATAQKTNEITLNVDGSLNRISNRTVTSATVAFPKTFVQDQYNLLFSILYDQTTDGELAAGSVPAADFEDHIFGIAGIYNSADTNQLSISQNDGMNLRLIAEDSDLLGSDFSGQVYTLDWRQYIRTGKESVFALRFVQGWGTDNPKPFRLGGDGSNENALDIFFSSGGQSLFDKRDYALRGYQEGRAELRGRRMQLLSGEWRFPLQRIEKGIMSPPIGIMQWFGNVFAEVGSAYQDSPETYYPSAGIEITADINLFYNLLLRTRIGYAHGFDDGIGEDQIYLKIGSSF